MDFFTRAKTILSGTSPAFWDAVRKEHGIGEPFRYLLGLAGIFIAVMAVFATLGMSTQGTDLQGLALPGAADQGANGLGILVMAAFTFCVS